MSEFVGRTGSKRAYSYPEGPRNGALFLLARNFASGPKLNTTVPADGIQVPWNTIDVDLAAWSAAVTYATGDLVLFTDGEQYISLQDSNTNNAPDVSPLFWELIEGLPITPRLTGIVIVSAVVSLTNETGGDIAAEIAAQVDGVDVPVPETETTVPANSSLAVPFLAEIDLNDYNGGVSITSLISIFVDGEALVISGEGSTVEVREVIASTG